MVGAAPSVQPSAIGVGFDATSRADKPKVLVVIGAGHLAGQALRLSTDDFDSVVLADDLCSDNEWHGLPVEHRVPFDSWPSVLHLGHVIVGLGYHHLKTRRDVFDRLREGEEGAENLIHPSAIISDVLFDRSSGRSPIGVMLYPGATLDFDVSVADGVIINVGALVCHDSEVGASTFLGPGVTVSGNVKIGSACFVGAGAVIRDGVTIGDGSKIAMGSVITRDVIAETIIAGSRASEVRGIEL